MQLSIEQLQAFVASVEAGSFSGAARKLNKAQSSISGLISNLEVDTGLELFDRRSSKPVLTEDGKSLLKHAKAVLRSHQEMISKVTNLSVNIESELRLAFDEFALPISLLSPVLHDFQQAFPTTALLLVGCTHNKAYQLIKNNQVDLAIVISQEDYPEAFHFRGIGHVHYGTVVASQHPLARLESVSKDDLSEYCHIRITDAQTGFRRLESDLSTNIWFTDDYNMMLKLVSNGFGWAELPLHAVDADLRENILKHVNTQHQSVPYPHSVDVIWPSSIKLGKAKLWLLQALTQIGQKTIR